MGKSARASRRPRGLSIGRNRTAQVRHAGSNPAFPSVTTCSPDAESQVTDPPHPALPVPTSHVVATRSIRRSARFVDVRAEVAALPTTSDATAHRQQLARQRFRVRAEGKRVIESHPMTAESRHRPSPQLARADFFADDRTADPSAFCYVRERDEPKLNGYLMTRGKSRVQIPLGTFGDR